MRPRKTKQASALPFKVCILLCADERQEEDRLPHCHVVINSSGILIKGGKYHDVKCWIPEFPPFDGILLWKTKQPGYIFGGIHFTCVCCRSICILCTLLHLAADTVKIYLLYYYIDEVRGPERSSFAVLHQRRDSQAQ